MAFTHLFYDQVLPQLPKRWLSHYLGAAAHMNVPGKVNRRVVKAFADFYKINLNEMEKPLEEYHSLGEFFSRKLKVGARPIYGEVIHPCDSTLINSGKINGEILIQAKGKTFTLDNFIPENPWSEDFNEGSFFTYYLAPHNYHRVHAPVTGEVQWSTIVPGELWPVNSWSVKNIDGLYVINERVACGIQTPHGKVIVVMVGATNVGSISMSFDPNIKTNRPKKRELVHRLYPEGRPLKVGDELGAFHLGSTVIVLYDSSWRFNHRSVQEVQMGQKFS